MCAVLRKHCLCSILVNVLCAVCDCQELDLSRHDEEVRSTRYTKELEEKASQLKQAIESFEAKRQKEVCPPIPFPRARISQNSDRKHGVNHRSYK